MAISSKKVEGEMWKNSFASGKTFTDTYMAAENAVGLLTNELQTK